MGTADAHANKRINLAAPLISVRRHAGAGAGATAAGLPAYKADATSGPLGHAGAVPFGWEHRPGHPKSVRTRRPPPTPPPPPLTLADEPPCGAAREPTAVIVASRRVREEERCADARDDVSCVTANCSAAGLSDAASACSARARPRPCAHGSVMMDRFLPAAHAVAAGSPQNTFRKAGYSARPAVAAPCAREDGGGDWMPAQRRLPFRDIPIPAYQYHLPPLSPEGKNVDDDGDGAESVSDAHSTAGFASRRCGLLPTRCVKGALMLSHGARRAAGRPFLSNGGGRSLKETNPLPWCSRDGQQQPQHTGDDPGAMQSWEEVYIKSLLRSGGGGGLMGPAAAVASELDRTVRELYKRRGGQAVHLKPKASHLGLILVLDRSNEGCGHGSPARKLSARTGDTASLLPATTAQKGSPDAVKQAGSGSPADAGEHGFPLLPGDKEAVAGRELALCAQPPLPAFPLPKSPRESWLSRTLPSMSTRPPATSFLGLHVQPKKLAPLPWCTIDAGKDRS